MLPFYNMLATPAGLVAALSRGDHMMVGIDLTLFAFGLAFLAVATRVARYKPPLRRPRAARAPATAPQRVLEEVA